MKLSKHGISYSLQHDPRSISKITFYANLRVSPIDTELWYFFKRMLFVIQVSNTLAWIRSVGQTIFLFHQKMLIWIKKKSVLSKFCINRAPCVVLVAGSADARAVQLLGRSRRASAPRPVLQTTHTNVKLIELLIGDPRWLGWLHWALLDRLPLHDPY